MYENEFELVTKYKAKGYKFLGDVMFNHEAVLAYNKSKNKEEHRIGRSYDFIVMHDLKACCTIDSSD